jgi:hypothetical protein
LGVAIVTIFVQLVVVARLFQNILVGDGIGVRVQPGAKEQRGDQDHAFHGNPPCLATFALPCWSRAAAAAVRGARLQIGQQKAPPPSFAPYSGLILANAARGLLYQ